MPLCDVDGSLFPTSWHVVPFIQVRIEPQGGGFRPIRLLAFGQEPDRMPVTDYPLGDAQVAFPLSMREDPKIQAAIDLVCSSFTIWRWFHGHEKVEPERYIGLDPLFPNGTLEGGFTRQPHISPWFRFLPPSIQTTLVEQSSLGSNSSAVNGTLNLYGRTLTFNGGSIGLASRPVLRYIATSGWQPYVGRRSAAHPLVNLFENVVIEGEENGPSLLATLVRPRFPRLKVARSFVFPLYWTPANHPDVSLTDLENTLIILKARLGEVPFTLPILSLQPAGRAFFRDLATGLEQAGLSLTGGWRNPPDDAEREEGPRTAAGRFIRELAIGVGLFALAGPLAGPTLAGWLRSLGRVPRELAEGIEASVEEYPAANDELRFLTLVDSVSLVLDGVNLAAHEVMRKLDLERANALSRFLWGVPFVSSGSSPRLVLQAFAALLRPIRDVGDRNNQFSTAGARNVTTTPIYHLDPSRFAFRFNGYREIPGTPERDTEALSPTLQFARVLDVAMELYACGTAVESSWLALCPIMTTCGVVRDGLEDVKDADMKVTLELFRESAPGRVLAFNWRQAVVDEFIGWWDAELRERGVTFGRRIEVRNCFYNIFCWMREKADREALDAVLGEVVAVEQPWGTSYQRRMKDEDGNMPIWRRLFYKREAEAVGWSGMAGRARRLTLAERYVTWPHYLSLIDRACETEFWAKPEPMPLIADALELPWSDPSDPVPAFQPSGSRPAFVPAPTPTCRSCSASWTADATAPTWT